MDIPCGKNIFNIESIIKQKQQNLEIISNGKHFVDNVILSEIKDKINK